MPPLLALLLLLDGPAWATNAQSALGEKKAKSVPELVADLDDEDAPERLYAARTLRRQVKHALRLSQGREGSESADDALVELQQFDDLLAPRCISAVGRADNITVHCADILGSLETAAALPALEQALLKEARPRPHRHLDEAVAAIRAAQAENPAPPSPSGAP